MSINIKIEHSIAKAGEVTPVGLLIELTAPKAPEVTREIKRDAKAIVFVIDRSGSMSGDRLDIVKRSIDAKLDALSPEDYLSIVTFDDVAIVDFPLTRIGKAEISDIRAILRRLETGGSTNLEAGYRHGLAEAARAPKGISANVILLSDGHANNGSRDPEVLGRLASAALEYKISSATIGIDEGYDENLLEAISVKGDGSHFAAYRLDEAVIGITAEIDELLNRTMFGVRVKLEVLGEFKTREASIRPGQYLRRFEHMDGKARAELGDLAAEQQKNVVFELNLGAVAESKTGKQQAIKVTVSYKDAVTGVIVESTKVFEVAVMAAADWVKPEGDADIVAELKSLRLQDAKEFIYDLFNQGREAEAREHLEKLGLDLGILADMQLSARSKSRMDSEFDEVTSFLQMDAGEAMKRLKESKTRKMQDRNDRRTGHQ